MEQTTAKLTVFFDPPFWAGLYEREQRGSYEACRIVFGAEPKDYEVYDYLLKNYGKLRFSPAIEAGRRRDEGVNPKRLQREIRRQLQSGTPVGTKAQRALSLQREQSRQARKTRSRALREEERARVSNSGRKSAGKSITGIKGRRRKASMLCGACLYPFLRIARPSGYCSVTSTSSGRLFTRGTGLSFPRPRLTTSAGFQPCIPAV